jgi:hypothetical protein
MSVRHVASQTMTRRLRFAGFAGLGVAVSVIGLAGVASAVEPLPSLFWTVDPPTLGETHSPNPVTGSTGVSTEISLELATHNDFGSNNAPTGKVTFTDPLGIITGHRKNEAVTPPEPGRKLRALYGDLPDNDHGERHRHCLVRR